MLPYTNASGQVYVQLYVFCGKNGIPKELKADAQEFFRETGVELRWTNLYSYASNIPNIVSVDFKQLELSKANDVGKIINKNLPVFSKHRNITAIQPSLKVTNSKQTNDPCIRVYVLGKGCVPFGESEIPNSVEDCLVDIVDGFWLETLDTPNLLTLYEREEYLRLGASIGNRGTNAAGTLGAILKDDLDRFYLLSCDHVIRHEREVEIIHPGWDHYTTSCSHHLNCYHSWMVRSVQQKIDSHRQLKTSENASIQLRTQIDSACNALFGHMHPNSNKHVDKLNELLTKPPRTVAHYVGGIREDITFQIGPDNYIDVAIAKLTEEEEKALKKNRFVEIIHTPNYPNGNVTRDESKNNKREWCKSGSSTGYTSLTCNFSFEDVSLRIPEHERQSSSARNLVFPEGDNVWLRNCILFLNNENLFSSFGDSGAVIFEKSGKEPQAMPGFGIVIAALFSKDRCVGTIAVPLGVALDELSRRLDSSLTLVSSFKTPFGYMDDY